jgi:hypothetical protein
MREYEYRSTGRMTIDRGKSKYSEIKFGAIC